MIDLHSHTTASDGRSSPDELVRQACALGIETLAVTDHDTMFAVGPAQAEAARLGINVIPGIEITAVHDGRDVHVLGYFLRASDPDLAAFLIDQRRDRRRRVREMAARLAEVGAPIELDLEASAPGATSERAIGRPAIAAALVRAGHARDITDAFDRFLSVGRPAFVPRTGATPAEVVAIISRAGGVSALAHPGKNGLDEIIAPLAEAGLTAIEVFHTDHTAADVAKYRAMAGALGVLITGGSDYHGPDAERPNGFGRVGLPVDDYARLVARASSRGSRG